MRRLTLFAIAVGAATFANAAYTLSAASSPMHEEWVLFVVMDIPTNVARDHDAATVATRLRAFGYTVTAETFEGVDVLTTTPPGEPDFQGVIWGLGRPETGNIRVDIRCNVGYLRGGCPDDAEPLLRERLDALASDSSLPLYTRGAAFGDYDFAVWDEFWLSLGQICLGAASVAGLTVLAAFLINQHKLETASIQAKHRVF